MVEVAHGEMTDWRARTRAFESMAVVGSVNWSLTLAGKPDEESVPLSAVSSSFFEVVGTTPSIGRGLVPADENGTSPPVMVISHGLWLRRSAASPAVTHRPVPVRFDAGGPVVPVDVVGVMPQDFDFPRGADVWMPAAPFIRHSSVDAGGVDNAMRWLRVFFVVGRTRPGVAREDAARDLTHVMRTADPAGGPEPNQSLVVTPIASYLLGPAEPVLWTLLAGAVLMLAGAGANVAGLQLARSRAARARTRCADCARGVTATPRAPHHARNRCASPCSPGWGPSWSPQSRHGRWSGWRPPRSRGSRRLASSTCPSSRRQRSRCSRSSSV